MDSRIIPPWAAVATIMPALGGPSSTTSHCSGEKAAFVVLRYSCPHCEKYGLLAGRGGGTHEREVPPGARPTPAPVSHQFVGRRRPRALGQHVRRRCRRPVVRRSARTSASPGRVP